MTNEARTRYLEAAWVVCAPLLLLAIPWVLTACQASPAQAVITATPRRPDAQIEVTQTPTHTLLTVVSQSGIGEADVQFRLIYGDTVITAAVASAGQPIVRQQRSLLSAPATEESLTAASRFWLPLRLVTDAAGEARIPLENGFFELEAPPDLLAGDTRAFRFEWIDFFR